MPTARSSQAPGFPTTHSCSRHATRMRATLAPSTHAAACRWSSCRSQSLRGPRSLPLQWPAAHTPTWSTPRIRPRTRYTSAGLVKAAYPTACDYSLTDYSLPLLLCFELGSLVYGTKPSTQMHTQIMTLARMGIAGPHDVPPSGVPVTVTMQLSDSSSNSVPDLCAPAPANGVPGVLLRVW